MGIMRITLFFSAARGGFCCLGFVFLLLFRRFCRQFFQAFGQNVLRALFGFCR